MLIQHDRQDDCFYLMPPGLRQGNFLKPLCIKKNVYNAAWWHRQQGHVWAIDIGSRCQKFTSLNDANILNVHLSQWALNKIGWLQW